jgi:hypothetical protein
MQDTSLTTEQRLNKVAQLQENFKIKLEYWGQEYNNTIRYNQ